jgi:signal peptidase I
MTSDDLRARLDAQIAARRSAGSGRGKHSRPNNSRLARWHAPIRRVVTILVVAGLLTFTLRTFIIEPFYVPSGSMESTLHGCDGCNDDYLLVNKLSYHFHPVHRGDVVVFSRPPSVPAADKVLVKRVIAVAGDHFEIRGGKVFINGKQLSESYLNPGCSDGTDLETQPASLTVPAGQVYVLGDNRCDSLDSRTFGPIKTSTIVGRAFVIVWPLSRIHWL